MRVLALVSGITVSACSLSEVSGVDATSLEPLMLRDAGGGREISAAHRDEWAKLLTELRIERLGSGREVIAKDLPLLDLHPRGRASVLAFFATYCPPCILEMPMLQDLYHDGVAIAGVSMDTGRAAAAAVAVLLDTRAVEYPVGILLEESMRRAGAALEGGLPFTLVLDTRGGIARAFSGTVTRKVLIEALRDAERPSQ